MTGHQAITALISVQTGPPTQDRSEVCSCHSDMEFGQKNTYPLEIIDTYPPLQLGRI